MPGEGTVTISCPQCGSPFDFREGARNTRCRSCATPLAVSGEAGIARYCLEEKLDLGQARANARKFFATRGVDPRLVERLRFEGGQLLFLPFWRLRGVAVGWQWVEREVVIKEDVVDESGRKQVVERRGPNEKEFTTISSAVDYSSPACDVTPFGLKGIATVSAVLPLKGMDHERLARRGILFDPVKSSEQVRLEAIAGARDRLRPNGLLQSLNRIELCAERLALISYPVWQLTFAVGDHLYPLVVDGINGNILKARLPGQTKITLLRPLATVAGLAFAFSIHPAFGALATLAFAIHLSSRSGFSLAVFVAYFFLLIERGEEVEHG